MTFPVNDETQTDSAIAIIGLAGRFPQARTVAEFWQNLRDGVETIHRLSDEEIAAAGQTAAARQPNYVNAASVLEDVELFDAAFFGYTPREAEIMDPQQRLFLECAWTALESAGYDAETYRGAIGVYAGVSMSTYLLQLFAERELFKKTSRFQLLIGNDKDHLPTRVSYKLNLKGPSVAVQTTCSTSLVAVHLACQSLLSGECDMALAGGASIRLPQKSGYFYQEGNISSPDGHCRTFDARAQGTISGSGVGVVVLKRLADALADGDCVHAVIRGSALNNDGSVKVGYTAPSVEGQAAVIAEALAVAGVEADSVSYVEAHGTATALGDPIEVAALTRAFRQTTKRNNYCALGSVKSNIGHLDAAAGVAGLIKTVLALKHRLLPPSLHYEQPNPKIDFANSPFYVNAQLSEWATNGTPRRAGVSSFGIGGTNAHVVLEEAPEQTQTDATAPWQLFVLSAKTPTALDATTANLAAHLRQNPDLDLADAAYTLQTGRRAFNHRRMFVCRSSEDALGTLEAGDARRLFTAEQAGGARSVVFMFSGQGSQYVNMGLELYEHEAAFRATVDECAELLGAHLGGDLRAVMYPRAEAAETARAQLNQTGWTQPALFVLEYALARLWQTWGVRPAAMIGHSLGEYVAACLSGVLSLADALALVAARARLMQQLPAGVMLAVPLGEDTVAGRLADYELSLAAVNAPGLCVVAGAEEAVVALEQRLGAEGLSSRRLATSHAFHSEMMAAAVEPFVEHVKRIKLNPPQIPYVSNVTGTWITAAEATDPRYWGRHMRATVRFAAGLNELSREPNRVLLEIGPGQTLRTLAKRNAAANEAPVTVSSLPHHNCNDSDYEALLLAAGRLWLTGVSLNWQGLHGGRRRQRLTLPTYPFERHRYWLGRAEPNTARPRRQEAAPAVVDARAHADAHDGPAAEEGPAGATGVGAAVVTTERWPTRPVAPAVAPPPPAAAAHAAANGNGTGAHAHASAARQRIITEQLRLMTQQLEVLRRKRQP